MQNFGGLMGFRSKFLRVLAQNLSPDTRSAVWTFLAALPYRISSCT